MMETDVESLSILDSIPAQIAVLDRAGTIIRVNDAWSEIASSNDLDGANFGIGANYLEACTGASGPWAASVAHAIGAVLAGEQASYSFEYARQADGGSSWYLMTVHRYKGVMGCAVVSHTNITKRKHAELGQLNFSRILEQSLNEIYIFDAASLRFIEVNEGARRNLGYSIEQLRGLTPVDIKPEYTVDAFEKVLAPLRSGRLQKLEFNTLHERNDGTCYPVEVHVQYMQLNECPVFVAIILDITERELAAQQQRLIQSTAEGIYGIDLNGNCTFCNHAMLTMLGYSDDKAFLGNNVHKIVHHTRADGTPYPVHECRIYAALRKNKPVHVDDDVYWRADGTSFPVEYWSYPVSDGGKVTGCVVSFVDVTERKAALELLRKSKELAESATETKSRFLAAASHDLRQPLQSLGLYLSVLDRQLERPKQREVATKMRESLDTMRELLDALLDLSKLDSGSIAPEKKDIRIRELLDRIVINNIQQAGEKKLTLTCDANDCVVHSDPALLERVIENFVTNAIRYTARGSVTITCEHCDNGARIAVRDTGIGIEKEELGRVFEEYYQLDNPVRDRKKGLGLGLSIVKQITDLLGHRITVASQPGEGSTFSIEVPFSTQTVAQVAPQETIAEARAACELPIILLVDDDPAIVDATTMLLETTGAAVSSALSGDDAIAQLRCGLRPDIVICDYRLPGYDGIEVIRRVRALTTEDLPTILMTGDTSADEIENAGLSNCTILHKPVDTDRLLAVVENWAT